MGTIMSSYANAVSNSVQHAEDVMEGSLSTPHVPMDDVFRFMDMPPEIRILVYKELTHETIDLSDLSPACVDAVLVVGAPIMPMMLISKEIKREYEQEVWLSAVLYLSSSSDVWSAMSDEEDDLRITEAAAKALQKFVPCLGQVQTCFLRLKGMGVFKYNDDHADNALVKPLKDFFGFLCPHLTSLRTFAASSMPTQLVVDEASAFFGNGMDFVDYTEDDLRALFIEALPESFKSEVSVKFHFTLCLAAFVPWDKSIMDDSTRDHIFDHPKNEVWYRAKFDRKQQKVELTYVGSSFRSFEAVLVDLGYAKEEDRKCLQEAEEMQPGCTEFYGDTSWNPDTVFTWEIKYTDLPGSGTS